MLAQTDDPSKVDDDGDGLIEIWTLTQLDHMRHNLSGTSYKVSSGGAGRTTGCGANAAAAVAAGGASGKCHGYELMANLDFSNPSAEGYRDAWDPELQVPSGAGAGPGWSPIGDGSLVDPFGYDIREFSGTFDGNGHTISNLYVNLRSTAFQQSIYAGLFGVVGGTLKNLGLDGEHMTVGAISLHGSDVNAYAGGLAGFSFGTVRGCYSTGGVSSTAHFSRAFSTAGGLFGRASGVVSGCYATGNVSSTVREKSSRFSACGGLVGSGSAAISGCYATGASVSTSHSVSVGSNSFSSAGGLAGYGSFSIANCYAMGSVASASSVVAVSSYAGGVVGLATRGGKVASSYATGLVLTSVPQQEKVVSHAGGVSGSGGKVTTCYYSGSVGSVSALGKVFIPVPHVVAHYRTVAQLKALTASTSGWSSDDWVFVSGKLPSLLMCGQSSEHVPCASSSGLFTLVLAQKEGALTHNAQVYTVGFTSGTLHYMLVRGLTSPLQLLRSPSGIRSWSGSGVVSKGSVSVSGDISLKGLVSETEYTLCAVLEVDGSFSPLLTRAFTTTAAPVDADGNGLIEIRSLTDLNSVRHNLSGTSYRSSSDAVGLAKGCPEAGCHGYELVSDLDFSDPSAEGYQAAWDPEVQASKGDSAGSGWIPIGDRDNAFTGVFDGNGYEIENLYINASGIQRVGLFGYVDGGVIRDVGLTGAHTSVSATVSASSSGYVAVGGLVGRATGKAEVRGCYFRGCVSASGKYSSAGGLVGRVNGEARISNCYATGDVLGSGKYVGAGGLIGKVNDRARVRDCYSGGRALVSDCFSDVGDVSGTGRYAGVGGLVGKVGDVARVNNCYATGSVSGSGGRYIYAGGLIGRAGDDVVLGKSYHSGVVSLPAGVAANTLGRAVSATALKALTVESSRWHTNNWDFGGVSQFPTLRYYATGSSGVRAQGGLICGQPTDYVQCGGSSDSSWSEGIQKNATGDGVVVIEAQTMWDALSPYPNPTSGVLTVPQVGGSGKVLLQSLSGSAVVVLPISAEGQVDLSNLPSGAYALRSSDGRVFRVVKR